MKCKDCYKYDCPDRCYTDDAECVLQHWIAKQFDWQSFRNQAAKDILCAMVPNANNIISPGIVDYSIKIADELIKQLKEKEEK